MPAERRFQTFSYKPAIREGREVPRFTKITDPAVIAELQAIKTRMYGEL